MKRIKATLLVKDGFSRSTLEPLGDIERYEESAIPKDKTVVEEHSFDSLIEGAFDFAQGSWLALKGFGKMSLFAVITLFEGIKYLWKGGVGSKKGTGKKVCQ